MKLPTLFAKLLSWFLLTLAIIITVLVLFFNLQVGLEKGNRLMAVGRLISRDLSNSPREEWDIVLERYSQAYRVDFLLLGPQEGRLAGRDIALPLEVMEALMGAQGPPPRLEPPPWDDGPPPPHREPPGHLRFLVRAGDPTSYWTAIRLPLHPRGRLPLPASLLVRSDSLTGHGLLLDLTPWIIIVPVVIALSALLWLPLARSITKPLAQMTAVTELITRGRFEVKLDEGRSDEIGRLSRAINEMSSRLDRLLRGQKRFLGDVAHELASPLARIQLGLGILESTVEPASQGRVQEVMEEVEQLSMLVNELLSFTRAEAHPAKVKLERVEVDPLVRRAVEREGMDIQLAMESDTTVLADPELLTRALSNVLRNANRYACGPFRITARREPDGVILEVADSGPGVPEEALPQLFEPFYRLEPSRDRDRGGVGLGLAIVKTCVMACRGEVSARNLNPGLAVVIRLRGA